MGIPDNGVNPGKRLLAAAHYVRPGAVFADIGTDHAELPVWLALHGAITRAYACDVAAAPLEAARRNIAEANVESTVTALQTDGFDGLDALRITDAAICGIGGELVVQLLCRAPFLKRDRVRLVLQPMSRTAVLRAYLAREGFTVTDERLVRDAGRQYEVMCAEYCGVPYPLSEAELWLGAANIRRGGQELRALAARRILHLNNILDGQSPEERERTLKIIKDIEEALRSAPESEKTDDSI